MNSESNILLYQTEDWRTKLEVRLENETVWLTQEQVSDLFQRERSVITKHINNVFKEGELHEKSNVQILHISGSDRPSRHLPVGGAHRKRCEEKIVISDFSTKPMVECRKLDS